jgi:undecaprenyl-diphosphatase
MLAVIVYFWKGWKKSYFQSSAVAWAFLKQVVFATLATALLGLSLQFLIEKIYLKGAPTAEVEVLFKNLSLISIALACAGLLILVASSLEKKMGSQKDLGPVESVWIGLIQGLCLPFRGFSRSGATISMGLLLGVARAKAEEFSFALAVVLTPPILYREIHRLLKAHALSGSSPAQTAGLFLPGLLGMFFSFLAGLLALQWLSDWLSQGRWGWFGFYCLAAAIVVWMLR